MKAQVASFCRNLVLRRRVERELDEELRATFELLVDEKLRSGLTAEDARRAARLELGSVDAVKEDVRDSRAGVSVETALRDVRHAWRSLRHARGFTLAAVATLALGIGATATIFQFVDAALIKPLPYADPSRLVTAFGNRPDRVRGEAKLMTSYLNLLEWQRRSHAFRSIAAFDVRPGFLLATDQGPQAVTGLRVTSGFFRTLGVTALRGRDFQPDEEGPAAPPRVMLSYHAWQQRFGGRADIVGATVTLQGEPHVVVGVLPASFYFPMAGEADFWTTIRGHQPCWGARGCRSLETVARLADGMSLNGAQASLNALMQQLRLEYGERNPESATVMPLSDVIVGEVRPIMLMLLSGASLLMVIACINVTGLLLTRSDRRTREIAVRNALGASSRRLASQFAAEAVILVACSGIVGLAIAAAGIWLLGSLLTTDMLSRMPYLEGLGVNGRLVTVTASMCAAAGVVFTLAPFARASAAMQADALKEGGRSSGGITWRRVGRLLVVAQLALAIVLLVGAGLLTKSLYLLLHVDTGIDAQHLIVANVGPAIRRPPAGNVESDLSGTLAQRIAEQVAAVPGIDAVGYADLLPMSSGLAPTSGFQVPGSSVQTAVEDYPVRRISARYFRTLGARLHAGREFTNDEVALKRDVVIINATAAKRYFPGENAVGRQIVIGAPPARRVVGVVADVKDGPIETPPLPAAYIPFDQVGFGLVIRSSQPQASAVPAVINAIRAVRRDVVVQGAAMMTERVNTAPSAAMKLASAWVAAGFAGAALLLSLIGLYGVIAYSVGRRAREIATRMALGAQRRAVYGLIMREAAGLIVLGVVLGTIGAMLATSLIRSLLFGVQSWDVPTLVAAAFVLAIPAAIASFIPTRTAATASLARVLSAE